MLPCYAGHHRWSANTAYSGGKPAGRPESEIGPAEGIQYNNEQENGTVDKVSGGCSNRR